MAALLIATQFAKAQTEKGNQTLGLNFQFQRSTNTSSYIDPVSNAFSVQDQKFTNFYIGPIYSYFIADNLDLGASAQYGSTRSTIGALAGEQKQVNEGFSGTVFLRKYFMYQNKFGLRAGPYAFYGHSKSDFTQSNNSVYDQKTTGNSYGGGINAELLFYPSKQLGVSLSLANLNYTHSDSKNNNGATGKSSGDSFNASFINSGLGLSVFYTIGH
ncbi:hypothetical protein BC343_03180 [Mucilaginibacter pedocola]|uniref:Outer membrane protein beta-barrel domain-containing protein n=2 Tax=Mucilaginibacter pedocola TaxID=1792845 RepID=A0A1S9PMA0_9SPHI|nr:hypothetical protein BC343_03180 [Mucilaginibacter pedocola]